MMELRMYGQLLRNLVVAPLSTICATALAFVPGSIADNNRHVANMQVAQSNKPGDVPKLDDRLNIKTFTAKVAHSKEMTFSIGVSYLVINNSMNLSLLTPLDLPPPYGKDPSPLPAPEYLTAAKAQLVINAGSYVGNQITGKLVSQGFLKSNNSVRALPRRVRFGGSDAHIMDAVICIGKDGKVVSRDTPKWNELSQWLSETDQFRDCIEVGPIFLEKNKETGFDNDAFGVVGQKAYQDDRARRSLWNLETLHPLKNGVVNPVFYCELANGTAAFGIAQQNGLTEDVQPMGLGDVAKALSGGGRDQNALSCERAILLVQNTGSYFGGTHSLDGNEATSKLAIPAIFAISVK